MASGQPYPPPPPPPGAPPPPGYGYPPVQDSSLPLLAGIFLLLGGLSNIIMGGLIFGFGDIIASLPFGTGFGAIFMVCGAIVLIFGLFALIGAIFSFKREKWTLVLLGSILGLFGIGFYFTGSLFCLIALIIVATSRQYYRS